MLIDAARMPWFHQSISQTFSLKNPANKSIISHFIVLASAWKKTEYHCHSNNLE